MINFYADFFMGLVYFVLWGGNVLEMYFDLTLCLAVGAVSIACVVADFLFFKAMEEGIVGVVVAIVASNFIVVTALSFCVGSVHMTLMQGLGIFCSVIGIVLVTVGDMFGKSRTTQCETDGSLKTPLID